ncbi:MAG: hypothetical protein U0T36_13235 [Saprospiraceae bacterium]|jgi:hypothetical protein
MQIGKLPEVFHGYFIPEWEHRVKSIDLYLLGSMAAYYFTGQSMTALLSKNINSKINILSLGFENALIYWIDAFDKALLQIESCISNYPQKEEVIKILRMLCYPDPKIRGHAKNIANGKNNFRLERVVTELNVLAKKAEFNITN